MVKTVVGLGILGMSFLAVCLLTTSFILNNFVHINKPLTIASDSTVLVISQANKDKWYGTGVVYRNNNKTFVWTCHHVVANNITTERYFDPQSHKEHRRYVANQIAVSVKLFNKQPLEIGKLHLHANIIRFSETDDLALLEIDDSFFKQSVKFPNSGYKPALGTRIFHVGNFFGPVGERSVSEGVSGVCGFDLDGDGRCYDRVGLVMQPGSSGGGVYETASGKCIGLLARGIDGQGLIVPFRRMEDFARRLDCEWALRNVDISENYLDILTDDKIIANDNQFHIQININ